MAWSGARSHCIRRVCRKFFRWRRQLARPSLSCPRRWNAATVGRSASVMRTLFLQAPSYDGFDGGAGSRYQARREIRSFWYPTWLAQPAALVQGSKLIDAPPHRLQLDDISRRARDFDLAVLHTSAPSFASDIKTIEAL